MLLFEKLKKNKKNPMHMPGHKRDIKRFPYLKGMAELDITEIEGFDNLHNPSGILLHSMEAAARIRGAKSAFYLVNGSTCGILASICAVLGEGDKVIMARNCHKSVYNGIMLSGAIPVFVYPEYSSEYGIWGSVNPDEINKKLAENPDSKLIIVTSPTYEGVISDIEKICDIAHEKNIPVLVDAAHGAHLGFSGFGKSATELGADIAVESLHKTLPSLTQTAICYVNGGLVLSEKIAEKLSVFETSSPSYLLLSSIDGCINELEKGRIFDGWTKNLDYFYEKSETLRNIEIVRGGEGFFDFDKSKILLFPKNQSGAELARLLRGENIEPEMAAPYFVLCMTGAGDTKKNLKRLYEAIDKAERKEGTPLKPEKYPDFKPKCITSLKEAVNGEKQFYDTELSAGKISAGYIWAYPPGVPILVPGEEISAEIIGKIEEYQNSGIELLGDIKDNKILTLK